MACGRDASRYSHLEAGKMTAAAVVLAISLIVTGCLIFAAAVGFIDLPDAGDDLYGILIVLLGVAARFVAGKMPKTHTAPSEEKDPEDDDPPDKPNQKKNGHFIAGMIVFLFIGCGGVQIDPGTKAWATCAGQGSLQCVPAAAGDSLEASAISYAACLAAKAIGCANDAMTARPNPPHDLVDLGCISDVAGKCFKHARKFRDGADGSYSASCVEANAPKCLTGRAGK